MLLAQVETGAVAALIELLKSVGQGSPTAVVLGLFFFWIWRYWWEPLSRADIAKRQSEADAAKTNATTLERFADSLDESNRLHKIADSRVDSLAEYVAAAFRANINGRADECTQCLAAIEALSKRRENKS